jgi:hypothetical protein
MAAGGAAFSAAGGAGGGATIGGACRGRGTTTGLSLTVAAGFAATGVAGVSAAGEATLGFAGCGGGGAATGALAGGVAGLAAGACCCCSRSLRSFSTSPGLEILERSILGLISVCVDFSREAEPDLAEKYFLTFSASSSSMELECVFFSVTPTSCNASRIALLFTSSSLARSLIRIFIPLCIPPGFPATRSYRPHGFGFNN